MSRNIRLFYYFNFFTDFRFYYPIAILYFSQVTGSFALGMSIFSIATVSATVFEIPTGIFSDFLGRKRTIMLGSFTALASVFFYALGGEFLFLAVGAIFEGVARSFYSGNNSALLYDSLVNQGKVDQYEEISGKTSSMYQLSGGIAAILGGFLGAYSFSLVFWLSTISQLICFGLSFLFIEPKKVSQESTNIFSHLKEAVLNFKRSYKLRLLSLSDILSYGLGEAQWLFRTAFVALVWPTWALGIAQALANIGATLGFFFAGSFIKKFGRFPLLIFASVYGRIVAYIALIFPNVLSPVLLASGSTFFGTNNVIIGSLMQKEFSAHQRATMGSLNSFAGSLVFAVFAIILGWIGDKVGPIYALIIANTLLLPITYIYYRISRNSKH